MLVRALYLRKAIDKFTSKDNELAKYKLSDREWEMCGLIVTMLMPFKRANIALQGASHSAIDEVFWTYESLFNKIDMVKEILSRPEYADRLWADQLHKAMDQMATKLRTHHDATDKPFVYPYGVILERKRKLILFKQHTFEPHLCEQYSNDCRECYTDNYELRAAKPPATEFQSKKCKFSDLEDETNDYRAALNKVAATRVALNEYDRYLSYPSYDNKTTLEAWKEMEPSLPNLSLMARDTYAVPATGAGVEWQFSRSGRFAAWTRSRLKPKTICESMKFKDLLVRTGKPLTPPRKRRRTELNRPVLSSKEGEKVEEEGIDEDKIQILQWEKEWWQKQGAVINN
jgi:hAT family C-terminal dimerisation region